MLGFVQPLSNFSIGTASDPAMQSCWCEGWGAAAIGALVGSLCAWLAVAFTNDFNARQQTCFSLYGLKKILRELALYRDCPLKGEEGYSVILLGFEKVVEKLDVEVSGLCSRPRGMDILIARSLTLFKKWDSDHSRVDFRSSYIASQLMQEWAASKNNRPCFDKVIDFQKFLKRGFPYRLWNGKIRSGSHSVDKNFKG